MQSGLRGRGGAGYPTGLKWSTVAKATGAPALCHLQRGRRRPWRFYESQCPEDYPFRVLEGMTIAAYAIGANQGYVYVRADIHWLLNGLKRLFAAPATRFARQ